MNNPKSDQREILEIIRGREKAKLAILKELLIKNMDWFETSNVISEKYYDKDFKVPPFIEILESGDIIEKKEDKYEIVDRTGCTRVFAANKKEIDQILSLDYGKGDFANQLNEQ